MIRDIVLYMVCAFFSRCLSLSLSLSLSVYLSFFLSLLRALSLFLFLSRSLSLSLSSRSFSLFIYISLSLYFIFEKVVSHAHPQHNHNPEQTQLNEPFYQDNLYAKTKPVLPMALRAFRDESDILTQSMSLIIFSVLLNAAVSGRLTKVERERVCEREVR